MLHPSYPENCTVVKFREMLINSYKYRRVQMTNKIRVSFSRIILSVCNLLKAVFLAGDLRAGKCYFRVITYSECT